MKRLIIRKEWSRKGFGIYLIDQDRGIDKVAKPVNFEWEDISAGSLFPPSPTFFLDREDFDSVRSSVINELIGAGIESSATANGAELKATKYHLEDMRKLVLKEER